MRFVLLLLLSCTLARADALSDLKQLLASASGAELVTAHVVFESVTLTNDGSASTPQQVTLTATDGPEGLHLRWPRELLAQAAGREHGQGGAQAAALRAAIDGLKPMDVHGYLNIARQLEEVLAYSELTEDRADTWQGRPARRLSLKLNPPLSKEDRKYIKELTAHATLWLDESGWPLAAERQLSVKGRAMLVITFEQNESESFEFVRAAGRLIASRHEKSSRGSGGGQSGGQKVSATLRVENS